jgi:hypothetical protein
MASGLLDVLASGGEGGVLDGLEVAGGAHDAESEQVAEASDVATGGVDLVQDAVLAQRAGSQSGFLPRKGAADADKPRGGAAVDEQVRLALLGQVRWR